MVKLEYGATEPRGVEDFELSEDEELRVKDRALRGSSARAKGVDERMGEALLEREGIKAFDVVDGWLSADGW